jgi:hypothetical protein
VNIHAHESVSEFLERDSPVFVDVKLSEKHNDIVLNAFVLLGSSRNLDQCVIDVNKVASIKLIWLSEFTHS